MSHATFLISRKISNHDCNSPLGRRYSLISDAMHYATNQESVLLIGLLSMHLKLKADWLCFILNDDLDSRVAVNCN